MIGCGRIANAYNVPSCLKNGGSAFCEFIALSDVDLVRLQHLKRQLAGEKLQGRDLVADARCYQDYRRLLADPAVDGVLIAVPDHWHAQMAIEACRAGSRQNSVLVYYLHEKPITNINMRRLGQ